MYATAATPPRELPPPVDRSINACMHTGVYIIAGMRPISSPANFSKSESKKKENIVPIFLTAGVVEQLADVHYLILHRYGG
jgi:hypothetical protein